MNHKEHSRKVMDEVLNWQSAVRGGYQVRHESASAIIQDALASVERETLELVRRIAINNTEKPDPNKTGHIRASFFKDLESIQAGEKDEQATQGTPGPAGKPEGPGRPDNRDSVLERGSGAAVEVTSKVSAEEAKACIEWCKCGADCEAGTRGICMRCGGTLAAPTQTATDAPEYFLMSEGATDSRWFICHKAGNHVAGPYRTHQEASVEMEKLRVFVGSLAPTDYRAVNTQPWCKHGVGVRECGECAPAAEQPPKDWKEWLELAERDIKSWQDLARGKLPGLLSEWMNRDQGVPEDPEVERLLGIILKHWNGKPLRCDHCETEATRPGGQKDE